MQAIKIQKTINNIIANDPAINSKINDKIFQLVAKNGTDRPFIISSRNAIEMTKTKDINYVNNVGYTIDIYSDNYYESIDIQEQVINQLSGQHQDIDTNKYIWITFEGITETGFEDAFLQSLIFNIKMG